MIQNTVSKISTMFELCTSAHDVMSDLHSTFNGIIREKGKNTGLRNAHRYFSRSTSPIPEVCEILNNFKRIERRNETEQLQQELDSFWAWVINSHEDCFGNSAVDVPEPPELA